MREEVEILEGEAALPAILIAGPTASGKSALALALAERLQAVIINADSMQVYRELRVLTARPSVEDEELQRHALYGHVPASCSHSVGRWLEDVRELIGSIHDEGSVPVFVGGTGLYFRALIEGLPNIPDIDRQVKLFWRARMEEEGAESLHGALMSRDPELAGKLAKTDTQRILRAIEVFESTKRRLSDWQKDTRRPLLDPGHALRFFLDPPRDWLYSRINERFDLMLDDGVLDEVAALVALDLDPALPAMKAHGVPHLARALKDMRFLPDAIEATKADIRHYAKRQKTWFRHQMPGFTELESNFPDYLAAGIAAEFSSRFGPAGYGMGKA